MIGIIGGYGAIGRNVSTLLQKWGKHPLKIGGRNPQSAKQKYGASFSNVIWEKVDVTEEESIKTFIKDCDLVINCTGPSHKISSKIAKICMEQPCHLIDSGFDSNIRSFKSNTTDKCIVYHAGATPGYSGILPIWCASKFDVVDTITTYIGAFEKPSKTGIEDYLEGMLDETNLPRAAWRNGQLAKGVLYRAFGVALPFFERRVNTIPIFDAESEYVARVTKAKNAAWHFALDGENTIKALDSASTLYRTSPQEAIEKLYVGTSIDTAGLASYFKVLVQIEGIMEGKMTTKTFVLDTSGTNKMSGYMVAATAIAVIDGKVATGIKPAYTIENAAAILEIISALGMSNPIQILDDAITELLQEEEGAI